MYILILLSILSASVNSTLLHLLPCKTKKDVFTFNFFSALIWMFLLFAIGGRMHFSSGAVLWGVLYGITQILFLIFKLQAMHSGPVSITTLLGNCSLLLSTSLSVLLWQEPIRIGQILGIILLLLSVFLATDPKSEMQMSRKWKLLCVFFFLFASAVGIVFKAFSYSDVSGSVNEMMFSAAGVMSIGLLLLSGFSTINSKEPLHLIPQSGKHRFFRGFLLIFSCGILSCLYNRLNITLSGKLPGAIFFPCFNGGVIVCSALLGRLFLKEQFSKKQLLGLLLGILAIVIVGIS